MKYAFARLFNSVWGGLATGMIVAAVAVVPFAALAETTVTMQGALSVANVTAGDKTYGSEVSASNDQVVKVQLYYENTSEDTEAVAHDVKVHVALPAEAGRTQSVTSNIAASNGAVVTSQVTVKLDAEAASLQYIPGSAVWKHNTGTKEAPQIVEDPLGDEVAVGAQGITLGDVAPSADNSGTVTILARVVMPGLNVKTESQRKGETSKWAVANTASAGETMRYIIDYQNTSNTEQKQVVVRESLPQALRLVPGSVKLYNTTTPDGMVVTAGGLTDGGIVIGNYGPGANAYVTFEATIAQAEPLVCGANDLRTVAAVRPSGMSEQYATAVTTVQRDCTAGGAPTNQPAPAYSCNALTVTQGDNRSITAVTDYTVVNGATLRTITYDFGDGSQPLVTDKATVNYTYTQDGTYTVTATLTVQANGADHTVTNAACSKQVRFAAPETTGIAVVTPVTDDDLPNSGPGGMAGLFVAVSVVGFVGHRLFLTRRLAREPVRSDR